MLREFGRSVLFTSKNCLKSRKLDGHYQSLHFPGSNENSVSED